jgi:hypothetical protein
MTVNQRVLGSSPRGGAQKPDAFRRAFIFFCLFLYAKEQAICDKTGQVRFYNLEI